MRGASVGTFALSTGVIAEAIMSGRMARRAVRALESGGAGSKPQLTMRQTVVFYIPLALTAMLAMGTQPMVTFMMGQSRMVVESLAVFPVISGLTFMFRSLGLSFQEVGVALLGPRMKHLRPLCKFGVLLALVSSSCLAVVAYSPLAIIWFRDVSGLSSALTEFAISPLRLMVLLPALSVVLSLQRSILLTTRRTTPITLASSAEIITIAGFLWIGIHVFDAVGIVSAAVALVIGRLLTNLWLARPCWRAKVLA